MEEKEVFVEPVVEIVVLEGGVICGSCIAGTDELADQTVPSNNG